MQIPIFIVIVIILTYYNHLSYQSYVLQNLLSGFYEADSSFCEEAGLDMFCLYLDKEVSYGSRGCYVLAKKDNEIIINEPTKVKINEQWCSSNFSTNINTPKYFNIKFENIDDECVEIFPISQEMRFYPACGKIVLYSGDTVTAVLYKNPINSETI